MRILIVNPELRFGGNSITRVPIQCFQFALNLFVARPNAIIWLKNPMLGHRLLSIILKSTGKVMILALMEQEILQILKALITAIF